MMEGPAGPTVARRSENSRPPSSISSRVRPLHATSSTRLGKSSANKSDGSAPAAASSPITSRPRSVPAFWEGPLEVQSTAVPLATRSLSARSPATSLSGVSSSSRQTGSSSTRQKRSMKRDRNGGSARRPHRPRTTTQDHSSGGGLESKSGGTRPVESDAVLNGEQLGSLSELVDSVPTNNTKANIAGFNIASHLQQRVERSDGSSSPEIDHLLQDIDAVLQPPSPDSSLARKGEGEGVGSGRQPSAPESLRSSHKPKRPKVAANFAGTSSVGAVSGSSRGDDGLDDTAQKTGDFKQSNILRTTGPDPTPSQAHSKQTNLTETITDQPATSPIPDSHISKPHSPDSARQHAAAAQIQCWYRDGKQQRLAEVQRVLQDKREELNRSRTQEMHRMQTEAETRQHQDLERQQRRAAKMQAARKTAIEELQRKREERREQTARIAQEEIALLQASGKIKRPRSRRKKQEDKKGREGVGSGRDSVPETGGGERKQGQEKKGEVPTAVPRSAIDEFFEAGDSRKVQTSHAPGGVSTKLPATDAGTHTGSGRNTYNDILETLKLLEAAPTPFDPGKTRDGGRGSADPTSPGYLSARNLQRLDGSVEKPSGGGKLQSILSYLDEMERAEEELVSRLSRPRSGLKTSGLPSPGAATSQPLQHTDLPLDTATAVATDVTATILAQRMELDNKTKTVEMLQKALSQQRELTVYHAKEMEKEGQCRLELQRQEYETTVQRHQCFIDQLIDDKKALSERCEQLVKELREVDKKFKVKMKTTEESHVAEVSKLKQVAAAADKLRREKWRAEETQRIKEATVKGLEPEIQRIIARGKAETQKLKALHEAELLQADERAGRRFVAQMEELRAQCASEKEQACAHERELARQRYEKLAEQEELSYQQQRRKLFAEVQAERERVAGQAEQQRAAVEREGREAREEREREAWQLKEDHSRAMEEMRRRHSSELRALEERLSIERQAWEENYMKKQETSMMSKEREMREALRQERDKEIEMVISHLEEETAQSKAECERAAEARIKRIREKYEAELREVERSERSTLEKFNAMKVRLTELEGEVSRLCALLRQRDQEVERVSEVAAKLTRERDNVADIVRQEFADRLVFTEEENRQLKVEMSELRARHRVELERVGKTKDREMEEVHSRVRQALATKEDNLRTLRSQHEAALKRADHLEMLLERQRKELLRK